MLRRWLVSGPVIAVAARWPCETRQRLLDWQVHTCMQRVSAMVMRQLQRKREVEGRHHTTRQHDTIIALHGADKSGCCCLQRSQVLLLGDCDTLLEVDNAVP